MRIFILVFLISLTFAAHGASKLAVLISVENPDHRPFFRSKDWSLSKELRDYFGKKMGSIPFEIVFFERANQEILHRELSNPSNIALFWISHATSFASSDSGLSFSDTIIDSEGHNVRDIFQHIHPNLKYLSVLGCKAGPILNKLKADGFLNYNSDLFIYAKDKNIYAKNEIRNSIKNFKEKIPSFEKKYFHCFERQGIPLQITRRIPLNENLRGLETSVKILNQGRLLGIFPKGKMGQTQSLTVYISPETISTQKDLKIVIDSGIVSKDKKLLLGIVNIQSDSLSGEWSPFSDADGKILGVTQNIFRYKGPIDHLSNSIPYQPFYCEKH
jgi:hypothetical protein